ncbi:hypothetical protein DSCA_12190 [Desulfosarcina alkanivorans]|uniref:Aminotransferase n=1 Tax=Desulfosarcina alkanivorans TaxID=571177 RepID=A0A5K7YHG6_9BACT|nr:aminotransferase class V-fold PLP-dependent enzyme [Desulfosarcina alkanivorans]BBO67289.1 hypothetical protein DSCA_12190 [Desulfosarcina alkanivorans]
MALNFLRNLAWYPPAETQIPWGVILSACRRKPKSFKQALCSYMNVNHCVLGQSARALLFKLIAALKQYGVEKQRTEVLIPGYTCYSVAAAVAKAGLTITVYDLDPKTLQPDLDSLEKAISTKTLAIVTQHLFGRISPMDELKQMARANGSYLIEDAAQSLGRVKNGMPPGTFGDFGLLSFGRGKPLPVGNGGALVSKNYPAILNTIRWENAGKGYDDLFLCVAVKIMSKPVFYWLPEMLPLGLGKTVFDPGFSVNNISSLAERIAADAITVLDDFNSHRRRIADIYTQLLNQNWQIKGDEYAISAVRYPVMLPFQNLPLTLKKLGLRRMYPYAIGAEKAIKSYMHPNTQPSPGAIEISKRLFTVPTHMGIDDKMAAQISLAIQASASRRSYK